MTSNGINLTAKQKMTAVDPMHGGSSPIQEVETSTFQTTGGFASCRVRPIIAEIGRDITFPDTKELMAWVG